MHPAYFETRFRTHAPVHSWPASFAVVTAYATTGTSWSAEANHQADLRLQAALGNRWRARITGYSPTSGHAEPGWAASLPFHEACDLGARFHQDAVYLVESDDLYVSYSDERRALVWVGSFKDRLDERHDHPADPNIPKLGPAG